MKIRQWVTRMRRWVLGSVSQETPAGENEKRFMRRAIELSAYAGLEIKSGGVFGAVIARGDEIISEGYNQVMQTHDPTCHAEIDAIRKASQKLGTPFLEGCTLYTSAECCPMCLAAAYWAHIDKIYFAAHVEDALLYGEFKDLDYYEEIRKPPAERKIVMIPLMREEAVAVWKTFSKMPDRARY